MRLSRRLAVGLTEIEPLILALALPALILPASYLWRAQRGLNAYDGLGDPALAWPSSLSYLALAVITLPYLARWVRDGTPWRSTPLDAPIALYVAAMALGLWPAVDRAHSLTAFLGLLGGVAVCYGAWHWGSRDPAHRLWPLVTLLVLVGCALAVLGYLQTDWLLAQRRGAAFLAPVHTQLSTLPALGAKRLNPSVVGNTLLPLIPLAFVAVGAARRPVARLGLALGGLLMLSYLVVVWSRGDLLALGIVTLLALLWQWRGLREAALGLGVGAVGAVTLAAVLFPATVTPLSDLAAQLYPARAMVWTRAAYIIIDHPFTGAGLDNFRPVARNSYPYFNPAFDQTEHAHSWPLQAGVDGGIWGLAAVVWLAIAFYVAAMRAGRWNVSASGSVPSSTLRPGFVAGFSTFFIGHLYDNGTMSGARAAVLFWLFLGAALVALSSHTDAADGMPYRRRSPAPRYGRIAAGFICLLVGGWLIWSGWDWAVGLWHNNMASVARNRGLYTTPLEDEHRAALAAAAVADYQRAVAAAPDLALAHRNLGVLYWQAAQPQKSARHISWTTGLPLQPLTFFTGVPQPEEGYAAAAQRELDLTLALMPGDVVARGIVEREMRVSK
ncbi:MAG: O-antigen ligase family protein [Anaerolineae bacterium]|nr:O-antigen ligase family protein [Anaerolineae bacterium]MDW8071217.1 O-antigen ligase family protein [Anaerolineae bacterium]